MADCELVAKQPQQDIQRVLLFPIATDLILGYGRVHRRHISRSVEIQVQKFSGSSENDGLVEGVMGHGKRCCISPEGLAQPCLCPQY